MSDAKFIDGLIVKAPHERAPEYVKAKLSIKREELIAWLQAQTGDWINADVKVSQQGKWYAAVDDWKPEGGSRAPQRQQRAAAPADDFESDEIPFDGGN
jgi:hypothetical protein